MTYLTQFQINFFSIVILISLYVFIKRRVKVQSYSKKILRNMMLVSCAAIILEPMTWYFDSKLFFGAYFLEYSTNFLLFLCGPVLGGLMLSYVDYYIFRAPKRLTRHNFYQWPTFFTLGILVINLFYPLYFRIDPIKNSFHSGVIKEFHYVVLGCIYLYMFVLLIRNRAQLKKGVMTTFVFFFGLPIAGMVIQEFESQLHFSWTSSVLGILIAYIFLESTSTEEDFLTKLYNRQSYEIHLNHLIEIGSNFSLILLDLNNFKIINDTYGHLKGDDILIHFSKALKGVFCEKAFVSRLGGDEFVVVLEDLTRPFTSFIEALEHQLKTHHDPLMQSLKFSYGIETYEKGTNLDTLYTRVDHKMYAHKRQSKNEG